MDIIESKNLRGEISRLEALCESRTKELSMHKLEMRKTLSTLEAMAAAFKYVACDVIPKSIELISRLMRIRLINKYQNIKIKQKS